MDWKAFLLSAIVLQVGAALADGEVSAGSTIFENTCSECHYEDDFAGKSQEEILTEIGKLATGQRVHKFDLSKLSENEQADVAAFFASFK